MAIDFPASPTLGQVFTSGAVTYVWNGYAWEGGGVTPQPNITYIGDTPPAITQPGQTWWESDSGMLFVNYNDGVGPAQWVQINALQANAVLKTGDTMTGKLGIGTAMPTVPALHVSRGAAGTAPAWDVSDVAVFENTAGTAATVNILSSNASSGIFAFSDTDARTRGYLQYLHASDTLSIGSSGPIAISSAAGGTTTITAATASTSPTTGALIVTGGIGCSGGASFGNVCIVQLAGATASPHGAALRVGYHGTNNYGASFKPMVDNGFVQTFLNAAGTQIGSITATAAGVVFNTSSDGRLKEDLKSFDAGHIIDDTEVYDFVWKNADERSYGIVAQQAVEIYPQAITYSEEEDWWGVDYSKYVPVLLQELKAVRARLAELEAIVSPKKGR